MSDIEGKEILPADDGAKPWLRGKEGVPVLWDGDHAKRIGTARVYEKDGALMADVEIDGVPFDYVDFELIRVLAAKDMLSFGVNGQVLEREVRDGVDVVTNVEILALIAGRS